MKGCLIMAKTKPRQLSIIEFNNIYYNNDEACMQYFIDAFHSGSFICPECGSSELHELKTRKGVYQCNQCYHQRCLFANTIFQDNKLPLYTLLLGIFIFINAKTGIAAEQLANQLGVNRKTGQLLCRKLRVVMKTRNSTKQLKSAFIECDVAYVGGKKSGKRGLGSDKLPTIFALGTDQANKYPNYLKIDVINSENKDDIKHFFSNHIFMDKSVTVITDGKTSFNILSDKITLESEKTNHMNEPDRLHWIHVIISNLKSFLQGTFHGIARKYLHLHYAEFEWRFNHRYSGKTLINSIQRALKNVGPHPRRVLASMN